MKHTVNGLYAHFHTMGIQVEAVGEKHRATDWLVRYLGDNKPEVIVNIKDQRIHAVELWRKMGGVQGYCTLAYVIRDEEIHRKRGVLKLRRTQVESRTRAKKAWSLQSILPTRKAISLYWQGGIVAESLNRDTSLSWALLEMGHIRVRIKVSEQDACLRIITPWIEKGSFSFPSKAEFETYLQIVSHIEMAMEK